MRLNKRTIAVSTAVLSIVGGAAFAYTTASDADDTGTGSVAAGSFEVSGVGTAGDVVLDTPVKVNATVTNTSDQPVHITHVKVEAAPSTAANPWDAAHCGAAADYFTGVDADLTTAIDLTPKGTSNDSKTIDDANIKVTLKNHLTLDQSDCTLRLQATVS